MPTCDIHGLKLAHDRFKQAHRDMVSHELVGAGMFAQQHVRSTPHFHPRTGKLQAETKFTVAMGARGGTLKLFNRLPYAAAIDKGARPHTIMGRPMLTFYWAKIGAWVSLHKVNHPGNRPYSFLHDAWARSADHFLERMVPRMAALAARF
jgi:hypothetical protein